ncbi:phage shock protein PspC (stress-responsive transcriptional regulator) [Streptomyces sp. PvR006]|uniref:PspC domain-containing protein n=1 Tax=unclassified Streptomyces TaxID=2593676 RepID=UPI001AE79136|nr:PspC domain-containing protein [Streptomyces sp. PvR006]MBP2584195.1 phage shock protein PspC (stress-responsive transcriptional regulator) [Streptomyces sp. PvR006]
MTSSMPSQHEAPPPAEAVSARPLRRSRGSKVVGGVCGGLGRYFDLDPVIFRVVVGVLAVPGGLGLIFYGFAWLLVPVEGEDENEGRRLLTGRVSGGTLAAVLMALVGCGVFLSMLHSGSMLGSALLVAFALSSAAIWSRHRQAGAVEAEGRADAATASRPVAEAPPETKAPPPVEFPSWWRDPIVKDGSTGKVAVGYLWGPQGIVDQDGLVDGDVPKPGGRWKAGSAPGRPKPSIRRSPFSIGGLVYLLAMVAAVIGTSLTWESEPLGTSLQTGLVAALAVFGLGLVVSSFLGRTGFGTVFLTVVTAGLLALTTAVPGQITTEWIRETWKPASVAAVQPRYELGTGVGTLDLSALAVPAGTTVSSSIEVGAGQLKVIVPKNAVVRLHAQVGLGDLQLPGEPANDIDISPDRDVTRTLKPPAGTAPAGTLVLSLKVSIGQVEVTRAAS